MSDREAELIMRTLAEHVQSYEQVVEVPILSFSCSQRTHLPIDACITTATYGGTFTSCTWPLPSAGAYTRYRGGSVGRFKGVSCECLNTPIIISLSRC